MSYRSTYAGRVDDVDVAGNTAVVAANLNGLHVIDISDVSNPQLRINLHPYVSGAPATTGLRIGANRMTSVAFDFQGRGTVRVYDFADPFGPVLLSSDLFFGYNAPLLEGSDMFRSSSAGFFRSTVQADNTYRHLSSLSVPGYQLSNFEIVGSTVFLCTGPNGLAILDISDPSTVRRVGGFDTAGYALDVAISGAKAFIADREGGIVVLDISNPAEPRQIGHLDLESTARDVVVQDNLLFVANGVVGLTVWNIAELRTQTIELTDLPDRLVIDPNFPVSATASSGLPVAISISGPATLANGMINVTGVGTVTVRATQAGSGVWAPVTVQRTFQVNKAPQTLTFGAFADLSAIDDAFTFPAATASSGLAVTYSINGPATISGRTVTITGSGTVRITATQAGNATYNTVSEVRTFVVRPLNEAIAADLQRRNPSLPPEALLPEADPDGDGLPNVVEFILRTDPTSGISMEGRTTATIFTNGAGAVYLRTTFRKPRTTRYRTAVEVGELNQTPVAWRSFSASFSADGTGSFLWPYTATGTPIVRFILQYP